MSLVPNLDEAVIEMSLVPNLDGGSSKAKAGVEGVRSRPGRWEHGGTRLWSMTQLQLVRRGPRIQEIEGAWRL